MGGERVNMMKTGYSQSAIFPVDYFYILLVSAGHAEGSNQHEMKTIIFRPRMSITTLWASCPVDYRNTMPE